MANVNFIPKDFRKLLAETLANHSEIRLQHGKRHACLVRPDGHKLTIPGTPSSSRGLQNMTSQVRRFVAGRLHQQH